MQRNGIARCRSSKTLPAAHGSTLPFYCFMLRLKCSTQSARLRDQAAVYMHRQPGQTESTCGFNDMAVPVTISTIHNPRKILMLRSAAGERWTELRSLRPVFF